MIFLIHLPYYLLSFEMKFPLTYKRTKNREKITTEYFRRKNIFYKFQQWNAKVQSHCSRIILVKKNKIN